VHDATIEIRFVQGPVEYIPPPPLSGAGGEAVFLGRTRAEPHPEHGDLIALDYTAYEAMARRELEALAGRVVAERGARFVRMHHSVGRVGVGEASVLIQVLCPHRAEAFEGCRFLIDRFKEHVPIWKAERWATGRTWSPGRPASAGATPPP